MSVVSENVTIGRFRFDFFTLDAFILDTLPLDICVSIRHVLFLFDAVLLDDFIGYCVIGCCCKGNELERALYKSLEIPHTWSGDYVDLLKLAVKYSVFVNICCFETGLD